MRLHRFYVLQPLGEEVVIDDVSLIKQWTKVFRYKKGDLVILFDGEGSDATYELEEVSPKSTVLSRKSVSPSFIPKVKVTLYLSIIKKDNFELAVQKATELGVSTIIPVLSERSEKKNISDERLQKIAIESSEQCGRGDVPTIMPVIRLKEILDTPLPHDSSYVLQMENKLLSKEKGDHRNIGLFVGPEGGWSDAELELFSEKNLKAVSISETTLRAETAAIVACAFSLEKK